MLKAFKKAALKVHPDKGGLLEHCQQLTTAKQAWDNARKGKKPGRPKNTERSKTQTSAAAPGITDEGFDAERSGGKLVHSWGVLLTYNRVADLAQWTRFVEHVRRNQKAWKVKYWCATLETTKAGKLHFHLFLQFLTLPKKSSKNFAFEGLTPRADCNDLLGDGWNKKRMQESLDRAFFYVWAAKKGTVRNAEGSWCVEGNYFPSWTNARCTYAVKGRWPEALWKAHKLTNEVYEEYLFACKDGVVYRKRNLDAVREREETTAQQAELEARVKRIRGNPQIFWPFPVVPDAEAWLQTFADDQLRYPVLVVLGKSHTGKTEWAQTLFQQPLVLKVGTLEHFPDGMRAFRRGFHDGVVLDDLRDLRFLVNHQDKLQGKYNAAVEFGSTPGGQCAFFRDLFAVPVVATANYSTEHLDLLQTDDWLGNSRNRVVVNFPPWEERPADQDA